MGNECNKNSRFGGEKCQQVAATFRRHLLERRDFEITVKSTCANLLAILSVLALLLSCVCSVQHLTPFLRPLLGMKAAETSLVRLCSFVASLVVG